MADTSTVGGVISGYCAIGNPLSAIRPAKVTMMDITEAKIGRSMKKRENMPGSLLPVRFVGCVGGGDLSPQMLWQNGGDGARQEAAPAEDQQSQQEVADAAHQGRAEDARLAQPVDGGEKHRR